MIRTKQLRFITGTVLLGALSLLLSYGLEYLSASMTRSPLQGLENQITDLAFQARSINASHTSFSLEHVVIIDIDDASIEQLGRPQLWPRAYDAFAISYIAAAAPKAIGIDYLYTEPDTLSPVYADILSYRGFENGASIIDAMSTDQELEDAIRDAGMVHLAFYDDESADASSLDSNAGILPGTFRSDEQPCPVHQVNHPVLPIDRFARHAASVGAIDMTTDPDGTVRYYSLVQQLHNSTDQALLTANFPLFMMTDALGIARDSIQHRAGWLEIGRDRRAPLREDGRFRINWLGRDEQIRYIPFYKVLSGRVPAEFFADKFIFFGTSASGMQDLKTVPARTGLVPGVEVHAIAFLNLMNGAFIREYELSDATGWMLLFAFICTGLFLLVRPFLGLLLALLLVFGEMFSFILWILPEKQAVIPIVALMLITLFSYLLSTLYIYFIRERKNRQLKMAFSSYVPPEVVEQISREKTTLNLDGEKRELTVLFSDIRDFTSLSEKLDAEEVVQLLNDYLSQMSEAIFKDGGTIDKFIGDAIMAIFGAPIPQQDHATRACRVALSMMKVLNDFNSARTLSGKQQISIGIGINTGPMVVGNIGSTRRFDYTVIGDEVNLASRLEGLTKYFGVTCILGDQTYRSCAEAGFVFRNLGRVRVKGKYRDIRVYELCGTQVQPGYDPDFLATWDKAIAFYEDSQLTEAALLFAKCQRLYPKDSSSRIYVDRCNAGLNSPSGFEPVINMELK